MLGEYNADRIDFFQKKYGLFSYSLDEKKELNKDLLQAQLEKITRSYDRYIKRRVDGRMTLFLERTRLLIL